MVGPRRPSPDGGGIFHLGGVLQGGRGLTAAVENRGMARRLRWLRACDVWGLFDGTLYNDGGDSRTITGAFKVEEAYFDAL